METKSENDAADAMALIDASMCGDLPLMAGLLARGVPVDSRDVLGRTGLMIAAANGRLEAMQYLLGAGADKDAVDYQGKSALMRSVFTAPACAASLLEAGCRLDGIDKDGNTVLIINVLAIACGEKGARLTLERLLAAGCMLDGVGRQGLTALEIARNYELAEAVGLIKAEAERRQLESSARIGEAKDGGLRM